MNVLVKYDAARFALQQAVSVDEVKDIRDKAQAMAAYAKQAKDTELVEWATEIKVRAERRAGQMLHEIPKNAGAATRSHDVTALPKTLHEIGISKQQSSRWQKLADVPDDQFERAVAAAKEVAGEVTTAAMLRIEKANRPPTASPAPTPIVEIPTSLKNTEIEQNHEPEYTELDHAHDQIQDLQGMLAAGGLDREDAEEYVKSLLSEIKTLKASLDAVTISRDTLMNENASLKRQCLAQARKIKKYESGGNVK